MRVMRFREEVYAVVRQIPAGKVATYGEVAARAGHPGAARAVGNALHHNPYEWGDESVARELWVPCHRVVAADGALSESFAFDGLMEQQLRLEAEGVKVKDGKVVGVR